EFRLALETLGLRVVDLAAAEKLHHALAAAEDNARHSLDDEGLAAHPTEFALDVVLHGPHGGHDEDDRDDAHENAEQGEAGAQLVRRDGGEGERGAFTEFDEVAFHGKFSNQ